MTMISKTWSFQVIIIFQLSVIRRYDFLIINDKNLIKNSTVEIPPVVGTPRLPPLHQSIELNLTDVEVNGSATPKNYSKVKEIREQLEEQNSTNNQSHNQRYEPSATTSGENYLLFNDFKENGETGFKPFIPSPLFVPEKSILKSYTNEYEDYSLKYGDFKSSAPVKQELFYSPNFNNYPAYGQISNANDYETPYSKFYDKEKLSFHVTTFSPPRINPMQRPFSTYKGKKKHPFVNANEQSWKSNEYLHEHHGKHHFDFGIPSEFAGHEHLLNDNYNIFNKPHPEKPFKKTGLLQILTTLIPIGLLLSALPPRVIFINSTTPTQNGNKPLFRNIEAELSQISNYNDTSYNVVVNMGLTPSDNPLCNKRIICEAALNGTTLRSSFVNNSLWHLLSRSSDAIRMKLNLQDVFETVLQEKCSNFKCPKKDTAYFEDTNSSPSSSSPSSPSYGIA